MIDSDISSRPRRFARPGVLLGLAAALAVVVTAGPAAADNPPTLAESYRARAAGNRVAPAGRQDIGEAQSAADQLAEQWGIEVTSIRLTANDHMIDFRYRVLDAAKAASLFERQTKPRLVHDKTGKVLAVPDTAKIGPLRNSYTPEAGKIYWMFFGNAGYLVKPGDRVTVVIGDFRAEDLVVE